MKKQAWCVWAVLVLAAGCARPPAPVVTPQPRAERYVRVQVAEEGNVVRRVALEDYVQGAVLSEFAPASGEDKAVAGMLEVQAIVARTYAVANRGRHAAGGFDLCATTHCQLYQPTRLATSRWAPLARTAVMRTAGEVLWHQYGPALPLFHADCGGHTSTPVHAWRGTSRPYLVAAPDRDVKDLAHMTWKYEVAAAELLRALNADQRTRVGSHLTSIKVLDRDPSGRAATIALHGQRERLVAGEDLRAILTRAFGARTVRSTLFEVRRENGAFVFEGRGFGHGVGLCQSGAFARIRAGVSPAAVLARYFPTTTIRTLDASHPGN